jgi:hypothetical protein
MGIQCALLGRNPLSICALIWNGPGGFWAIAAHKWAAAAVVISNWSNSNCPTTPLRVVAQFDLADGLTPTSSSPAFETAYSRDAFRSRRTATSPP